MLDFPEELEVTERVALITWAFRDGAAMTVQEVASRLGFSDRAALHMLNKLARVLPIYRDGDRRWRKI